MTDPERSRLERRVLVLAPTARDASLTESVFARAAVPCHCCASPRQLCAELDLGASAVLLPEEAVGQEEPDDLFAWLGRQPPWSDLPVLVLSRPGADSAAVARAMDQLGNVIVLERPTRVAALVSAARTALRARQRQYQIRDHLAEKERAEAELREADRRKDEFLAILAHELRNPLAPIRNSLYVLRLTDSLDSGITRLTETMERQVMHMVRLVDDLLEVSRITRGKIELRREPVELASVIRTALEASQPLIDGAGHRLVTSVPAQPLWLDADPVRLAQVFENLLNNAAKYTEPGGRIWLTVQPEDGRVAVSVRDSGTGIPAEMLPRVFDLFMQVDRGADRAQGGLGIGLTLVKSLVEMHGGSVEGFSAGAGQGSEFVVRLPLPAVSGAPAKAPAHSSPVASLAPRRVLVVDDNRDAADSMGLVLRMLGAEARVVYSGPEALEALETWHADVLLLDVGMPGMDGHEVARRVRQRPDGGSMTLIALTGWGQDEDVRRTRRAGFDHHLVKPVDVSAVRELLGSIRGRTDACSTSSSS